MSPILPIYRSLPFARYNMHAEANEGSGISGSQTWCDYLDTASRSSSKRSTTDQVMASPTGERLGNRTVIA